MNISEGVWRAGPDEEDEDREANLDPNEIIVAKSDITIVYDSPFEFESKFTYHTNNPLGFTRKELSELIMKQYHEIYSDLESEVRKFGNNPTHEISHPKYGRWSHDIDELNLRTMYLNPDGTYHLGIDT